MLVQVKGGHVKSGDIRDFVGTLGREEAEMGVFVTLEESTQPMRTEAAAAGTVHVALGRPGVSEGADPDDPRNCWPTRTGPTRAASRFPAAPAAPTSPCPKRRNTAARPIGKGRLGLRNKRPRCARPAPEGAAGFCRGREPPEDRLGLKQSPERATERPRLGLPHGRDVHAKYFFRPSRAD